MTNAPDWRNLSRRYVDLWQEQVGAMASDPAAVEALAKTLLALGQNASSFVDAVQASIVEAEAIRQSGQNSAGKGSQGGRARADQPSGADRPEAEPKSKEASGRSASAAAAPDDGQRLVDQLLRRIGALEDRIAALEAGAAGGGRSPRPRARPGKS